ncbi:hypothetical protein CERSUDRAFT_111663 [Gelatoporia subvermispora B]|uniref:KOW domain-containing protein n=1 Tax=Ceriporiopsis subvermispora (strain B) TaxID=914234 RepID=M2PW98_CERS8|nr:hypothetical protein CERSUDRAFT_111663 [Gelatoporia subvermispora B]
MPALRTHNLLPTHHRWTKDFLHLLLVPRFVAQRKGAKAIAKPTKPKDRIKYWNIVPGDQVRLLGDKEGGIHEVHMINRFSNRVFLKRENVSADQSANSDPRKQNVSRQVPYSRCQLFCGNFLFPPAKGETEPQRLPVFATRLSTSKPFWHPILHRFEWKRYAVGTIPKIPGSTGLPEDRLHIPWPKPNGPRRVDPSSYDTLKDVVTEVTYTPPALPSTLDAPVPSPPSEQWYITTLRAPHAAEYDPSVPVEVHVAKELTNPHSRAKKQARWQAYQEYRRRLLTEMVKAELRDLQGRTRGIARAEATHKWKLRLEDERKAEVLRRWRHRGDEARLLRKKERKARRERKEDARLRNLVLEDAPNQVVPRARA